ncbi:MAG TPA: phosphate signaling complex protein PhoU [Chloroflexota bacterium]
MTREHYDELLRQLDDQLLQMGDVVATTIESSVDALDRGDAAEAQRLIEGDNAIDDKRYDIEEAALVLIATQQPLASDLRIIASILTIATELERIGDYCEGIARLTLRMAAEPIDPPMKDIRPMAELTQKLLRRSLQAFKDRDLEVAGAVWIQDSRIDNLYSQVFRDLLAEMAQKPETIRGGTYLLWVAHNIERMADRVTNIAERVAFIVTGNVAPFRERLRAQTLPG